MEGLEYFKEVPRHANTNLFVSFSDVKAEFRRRSYTVNTPEFSLIFVSKSLIEPRKTLCVKSLFENSAAVSDPLRMRILD